MKIYYDSVDGGNFWEGPFSQTEFDSLRACGIIDSDTLVREERQTTTPPPLAKAPQKERASGMPPLPVQAEHHAKVYETEGKYEQTGSWYVCEPGQAPSGPFSKDDILRNYAARVYSSQANVWSKQTQIWIPIRNLVQSEVSHYQYPVVLPHAHHHWTLGRACTSCLSRYTLFQGRSCRAEYWYFQLGQWLIFSSLLLATILSFYDEDIANAWIVVICVGSIFFILPNLSAGVRRLHDAGYSGFLFLVSFIPIVGEFILLLLLIQPGSPGRNEYGDAPLPPVS